MSLSVYLSGPISGRTYRQVADWREHVETRLNVAGFCVYNPLRGHSWLSTQKRRMISPDKYPVTESPMLSDKALMRRDILDVVNSDIILANFMEATERSIGSIYELAIAYYLNKLVVVAMPEDDHIHNHPFIRETGVIFHTL